MTYWFVPVALAAVSVALPVASAAADPSCPTVPQDYTGEDDTIRELRQARQDSAHFCAKFAHSTAAVIAGQTTIDDHLDDVGVHVASGPGVDAEADSLRVDTGADPSNPQTVHLSEADEAWTNENLSAIRADIWFLVGLIVFMPFGVGFLRAVMM